MFDTFSPSPSLTETLIAAVLGALAGAVLAFVTGVVLGLTGVVATGVSYGGLTAGAGIAVVVSIVAALATSILPTWKAASRSPIHSLASGG